VKAGGKDRDNQDHSGCSCYPGDNGLYRWTWAFSSRPTALKKTIILVFMQDEALKKFRAISVWQAGVDGSVAVVELGAGGLDQHDQR